MELLGALEKKIENLVGLVRKLQAEKGRLDAENKVLQERTYQLESALLKSNEDFKELDRERAFAKSAVNELIADIDSLIQGESRE